MERFSEFKRRAEADGLILADMFAGGSRTSFYFLFDFRHDLSLLKDPQSVRELVRLASMYGLHAEMLSLQARVCRISHGGTIGWAHGKPYAIPGIHQTITLGEWLQQEGVPFYAH